MEPIEKDRLKAILNMLATLSPGPEDGLSYEEQEDATADANAATAEDDLVDLSTTSLVEKVGLVLHDTYNMVLTGELQIETGEELLAITQAVALREQLRVFNA